MTGAAILAVSLAVALLMWLALDDITTGNEPGYVVEWTAVALGSIWFVGLALGGWWKRRS